MAEPTPAPSSPRRAVNNGDIAADNDCTSPAFDDSAPVRLLYGAEDTNKRIASPNRGNDALPSPPKHRRDTRASPFSRRRNASTIASDRSVYDLFAVDVPASAVRPSPRSVGVVLSPEQAKKLQQIITTIKKKPLSQRRAILPLNKRKAPPNRVTKRANSIAKAAAPQKKQPKSKKSILNNMLFTKDIRDHIFTYGIKDNNTTYTKKEIHTFEMDFQKQLKFRFDAKRQRRANMAGGVTTRARIDIDLADEDTSIRATNFKELSRYVLDDLLGCTEKTQLLLCIKSSFDEVKKGIPSDAALQQLEAGIAGEECKIGGEDYYCLRVVIARAPEHAELISGQLQRNEFVEKYQNDTGGFTVHMTGTVNENNFGSPFSLTFPWKELIEHPHDIMFFGTPFNTTRPFDQIFKDKGTIQYVHHVFRHLSAEYWGDANASAQLYAAYYKRKYQIIEDKMESTAKEAVAKLMASFQEMDTRQKVFCSLFDGLCENEFGLCITEWNDYGEPIVLEEDLQRFMWAAEHKAFPNQWKVLAGMRGINEGFAKEKERTPWKRRQVFFQLLSIIRVSNPQLLSWWAMIQSVANFGWGVGATAGDIMAYWGNAVASSTRNSRKNPWKAGRKLLAKKDYVKVKAASDKRIKRTRKVAKFIADKVTEMEIQSSNVVIGTEKVNVLPSPWTIAVHDLRPNYYRYKN